MAAFETLLIKTHAGAFAEAVGARLGMKQTVALDEAPVAADTVEGDVVKIHDGQPVKHAT